MSRISAVIITLNEEDNIGPCLETLRWVDEVTVLDSGSTDLTVTKAQRLGAQIFHRSFDHFAAQKNAAIEKATGDWILIIDADERIPAELARRLRRIAEEKKPDAAYAIPRTTYFFGKPLRFSGTRSDAPIRFFPKSTARFQQKVHETVNTELPVKICPHAMIHYSTRNRAHYELKLQRYLPLEIDVLKEKNKAARFSDILIRPVGQFANLYLLNLGFLDGWTGLQYAGLSSWYVFLKYARFYKSSRN